MATPYLSPEQLERVRTLLPELSARDRLCYLVALYTGFRIREILSTTISSLYHQDGSVREFLLVARASLKGGAGAHRRRVRSRSVPVHEAIAVAARPYWLERQAEETHQPEAPLFLSRQRSGPISVMQAWRIFRGLYQRAGLCGAGMATHVTRRTYARMLYENSGHDLELVRMGLSHTNIATTARYIRKGEEEAHALIRAL